MQALVLGGGGAKGSYEMGVWKALRDMDIKIDLVVGTSIGAVNGALIAQGDYEIAKKLWFSFDIGEMLGVDGYKDKELKEKVKTSLQSYAKDYLAEGGIDAKEFKETLESIISEEKVRNSPVGFGLVTVELPKLTPVEKFVEEIPQGELVDYIMASSAIAPALKPYEIDGKKFIDGAYYDNIPMELAKKKGASKFIVVDLNSFGRIKKDIFASVEKEDLQYIRCYWDLGLGLILDENLVRRNMDLGYFDTLKAFQAFEGNAYTFIKDNKVWNIERMKKDSPLARRLGLYFSRKKTVFDDKLIQAKWKLIMDERVKRGGKKTNDIIAGIEIIAEILEIDPTKIYTMDAMNQKIKERLEAIELPEAGPRRTISPKTLIKNITKDLEAMADDQKRLKYFAQEIKKNLGNDGDATVQQIAAGIYTRTFVGALYIAMQDLI